MTDDGIRLPLRYLVLTLLRDGTPRTCSQIALELGVPRGRVRQCVTNAQQENFIVGDSGPTSNKREKRYTLPRFSDRLASAIEVHGALRHAASVFSYAQKFSSDEN